MIKHLFWLYTLLLILVGCTEETIMETSTPEPSDEETFYATFEGTDSRTYLDEQGRMYWNAEDRITLFKKNSHNRTYMFTGKTGDKTGGFKAESINDEIWDGVDMKYNCAVYPHSANITVRSIYIGETQIVNIVNTLPAEQTYAENSFGQGVNTMVAISENNQLTFKNVCSALRIRLYGENITVSSIILKANNNQPIAGKAEITAGLNGDPTCKMRGNEYSIRLNCPTPVTINSDAEAPTNFWIVLPPVTLPNGFTLTVITDQGDEQIFKISESITFKRNTYYNFTKEINADSHIPYITFTAESPQTFNRKANTERSFEYSVNGGNWTNHNGEITFGGEHGKLRLRGKNPGGTALNNIVNTQFVFGNETPVACTGDIRTLVDYENHDIVDTSNAKFCGLFENCTSLIEAPELPAMNLAEECYRGMFRECTNLKKAPKLPATTLAGSCYNSMFQGCTNLTEAPELPATTLADNCYGSMFQKCTSLTVAPELSAMNLDKLCCQHMFWGCTSLIKAPELPAMNLAENCYLRMFYGCTSLIKAPELPATNLAKGCYSFMFTNCTSLTEPPTILPAMDLAITCYSHMFDSCTSLTKSPVLPATKMVDSCYYGMFNGCSSLNNVTMLATDISAYQCLDLWLYHVPSTGTFIKNPAMTSWTKYMIPEGWEVKDYKGSPN